MAQQPTTAWVLGDQNGIDSLKIVERSPSAEIGEKYVLVNLKAASLNYRDIVLAKGSFPLPFFRPGVVPGSDGAGVVEEVGSKVEEFQPGDRVCTYLAPHMSASKPVSMMDVCHGLGQEIDGALQSQGVFHETALVHMPKSLDFVEASTLPCSGLTAWNALFGVRGYQPGKGDFVLVQGTGGVSVAALQFAVAAGATVISTTSSEAKATRLKALGAHHVINYREQRNWGEVAKSLTPDNEGVQFIVDVGGLSTMAQSFKAIQTGGMIALAGLLGQAEEGQPVPSIMDCQANACITRGFLLGTRDQFREMNDFVDKHAIKPIVDDRLFNFGEVKEAYRLLDSQQHFSKVCIKME